MFREPFRAEPRKARTSGSSSKNSSELISIPFMSLDLTPGAGNLLDEFYWELLSPWRGESLILNTGPAPHSGAVGSTLSSILEELPHPKYYLTRKACAGIIRRSSERGKPLPPALQKALELQAGIPHSEIPETADTHDDAQNTEGAAEAVGFDGYNGDLTGEVTATLGTNCGMSTGRNGIMNPIAFAANQRDEVRDLHNVAGALGSQPGMKQQTFIASGVVSKGNGDCLLTKEVHTSLSVGGGQVGQGYPCVLTAGFLGDSGSTARDIGYQKECAPTLKAGERGPSVLCLNDQGGQFMSCSMDVSGTLRSQMNQHQPLILESNQEHATVRTDGITPTLPASMGMGGGYVPMVYENHGIDSRYTGPHRVSPTISARCGTGGNNVPLVGADPKVFCIMGNAIDREPQNGGNGIGYQADIAYTVTTSDRHAIFSRQRTDVFVENEVVSTESARQHKDATDLVMQTCGKETEQQGGEEINQNAEVNLIRRLTPLECERLQGFPDGWTNIPAGSDSARYKALGNSVAIPCVEYVMHGVATVLTIDNEKRRRRQIPRVVICLQMVA